MLKYTKLFRQQHEHEVIVHLEQRAIRPARSKTAMTITLAARARPLSVSARAVCRPSSALQDRDFFQEKYPRECRDRKSKGHHVDN